MYYRSIGSGLGIGRYSKSNDSDSDSRAKKPDRDIPKYNTLLELKTVKYLSAGVGFVCR